LKETSTNISTTTYSTVWKNTAEEFHSMWQFFNRTGPTDGQCSEIQAPHSTGMNFHSYGDIFCGLVSVADANYSLNL